MPGESGLKQQLFSLQADSGAFLSSVHNGNTVLPDYNGFATALVLREMEKFADEECQEPLNRALDFLQECEWTESGMFSFWPRDEAPSWAPYNPEECDSSAVIAAELFYFGRIDPERARFIGIHSMSAFQTSTGEFLAWRTRGLFPNPVDFGLNVNVAAFLAQTGSRESEAYRNVCRAICDMADSCGDSPERLHRLCPYYPEKREIFLALDHALRRGVTELLPAVASMERIRPPVEESGSGILFANEGQRTVWRSDAVSIARRISGLGDSLQFMRESGD
jgi:hypothetical protein